MSALAGSAPAEAASVVTDLCPYVLAEGGSWRSTRPATEHRCHAVRPPALLTGEKQRRLCLVVAYRGCPSFIDARQRHDRALADAGVHAERLSARRTTALTRPTQVVFDRPFPGPQMPTIAGRRRRIAELMLVTVMLLAAVLLLAARLAGVGLLGSG